MKYHIRVRADFSDTIEVEANSFEEADLRYLEQWKADIIKAIVVADDIHDFKLEDMDKLGFKLL